MKIFLAGATGVVGRLLLPMLVKAGHDIAGTTRSAAKAAGIAAAGGRPVVADALDREAMFAALRAEQPDVLIYQLTDLSGRDFASNARLRIEGSRNLIDAALAVDVQRMIAQSIAWVYAAGAAPAHEDEPLDPGRTSAVQVLESAVSEVPSGVILRYGILYGPGTWYARNSLTTEQVRRGELVANDAVTSFLHVADAAQAALVALDWPAGVLNIVDDVPAAAKEWLPVYASLVGAPPPPVQSGREGWERGASNAKARQLGWRPLYPTWWEGFKEVLS